MMILAKILIWFNLLNQIMKYSLFWIATLLYLSTLISSILGLTLFLIFINNISKVISSWLCIYADETNIYSCLNGKSDRFLKVKLASVVNQGKKRLIVLHFYIEFFFFQIKSISSQLLLFYVKMFNFNFFFLFIINISVLYEKKIFF